MNPGFGPTPFNIANIPSQKELWKQEPSRFRHWMILFIILLVGIIGLYIAIVTIGAFSYLDDAKFFFDNLTDKGTLTLKDVESTYLRSMVIFPGIMLALLIGGFVFFIYRLVISYQKKSFAYLSSFATTTIGFLAFFAGIELIYMIFDKQQKEIATATIAGILALVTKIVFIIGYYGVSRQVARIRNMFMISIKAEAYKKMMAGMGQQQFNQNPFGPAGGFANPTNGTGTPSGFAGQAPDPESQTINPEIQKLNSMTVENLKKVADKLSISGSSTMTKAELVAAIAKVTQQ